MAAQHEHSGQHKGGSMGSRGVTRLMMNMKQGVQHEQDGKKAMMMSEDDRRQMLHHHHQQTLWIYWMLVLLGAWLLLSPLTFSPGIGVVAPSGGREVWLSLQDRIAVMTWSDIISGALLIVFGWRTLKPDRPVSAWICCFIGVWVSIAPLVFWAPTAASYLNDTLVGMLVISLTVLIPGMPNMIMYMKMGSEVPPGWSYNPSSWPQRWIMIATGFLGFIVSRYLAAFQLGYIDHIWDPFFGESSQQVLNSAMSHSQPVSDAGVGALAYTFEFLMGFMGSPSRWRTMPWMVTLFGILVIPLGLVHITLVISQPLVVGAWCTFCLLAAAIMLPMIPLEVDEVIAMGQHMLQSVRRGEKFWSVFWKGGKPEEMHAKDERSPALMSLSEKPGAVLKASVWGMSAPWSLVITSLLGIAAMALPGIIGLPVQSTGADIAHLCGALIVVFSVISMGEVVRALRWLNIPLGLALAALPWFVAQGGAAFNIGSAAFGIVAALLSLPRGTKRERYGLWDKYVV